MTEATRKKLTDILSTGETGSLRESWGKTEAAADFVALPGGTYIARVVSGELFTSTKKNTPGYRLAFRVLEGEHTGRQFWHDSWLTAAALPMTKRDLAKLGVMSIDQLEQPLPPGIRVKAKVVLRTDDDGESFNKVRGFEVLGIDADPAADPDFGPEAATPEPAEGGEE